MPFQPPTWPVSVKGVVLDARRRVLLLRTDREEWELPGGLLERGSWETGSGGGAAGGGGGGWAVGDGSPQQAVEREVHEETGWRVTAGPLIDGGVWIYEPIPGRRILIVTYGCTVLTPDRPPVISAEHTEFGLFEAGEVNGLALPDGYKRSIATWYACA
ncbi:MAG TPA: NUDIX hydrolase [Streptosporangiaceae bacterium]|nr:NUDIX hydrolase [Streptosporangiaceae bacterium]